MVTGPLRVGRSLLRTLYVMRDPDRPSKEDVFLGIMETPGLAQLVVDSVNAFHAHAGHGSPCEKDPVNGTCGRPKIHAVLDRARCTSCEHYMEFHQADGCWYAVEHGRLNQPMGCPCGVPVERDASS